MAEQSAAGPRLRQRLKNLSERFFVDRELFLRANDRVQYLRISARSQKWAAAAASVGAAWLTYSTLAYFLTPYMERAKDAEIAQHRLAYFDLLSEVSEYHGQFAQITHNLQENQEYLLSLVGSGDQVDDATALSGTLKASETEYARVALARDSLRERLQHFEAELQDIAQRNGDLQQRVAGLKDTLHSTEAERQEVAAARERLGKRLLATEQELALTSATKLELESAVRALVGELASERDVTQQLSELGAAQEAEIIRLRTRLTEEVAGLQDELRQMGEDKAQLAATVATLLADLSSEQAETLALTEQRDSLTGQVRDLRADLARAADREVALQDEIGSLGGQLGRALDRGDTLARQRGHLQLQLAGLESIIAEMHDQQLELVDRVVVRTLDNITDLEDLVGETGLDVDQMLAKVEGYGTEGGQGGPFIPAEELLDSDASYELQVSVAMLDLRLDRWDALQRLVQAMPLGVPLEHYELTSDFGYRRDPVNGRSALHTGIDFAAPRNTPLYTTGPGVVTFAGWRGRYGRVVEIDHGFGIKTRYAHLATISVKKGQEVLLGEEIGLVGTSGRATGPHVHYEILFEGKPYDPMNFIKAGKDVL